MKFIDRAIEAIVDEFETRSADINMIFFEVALEEDTNMSDEVKEASGKEDDKPGIGDKISGMITKLIQTIKGAIEKAVVRISNFFTRLAQSDEGFKKNCRKAMHENKPYNAIKLVVYQYDPQFLDTTINKVTNKIGEKMRALKTDYVSVSDEAKNDMDGDSDTAIGNVFSSCGVSNVSNTGAFFSYLKEKFRKEKAEVLFKAENATQYYNIAVGADKLKNVVKMKQQVMAQQFTIVRKNLEVIKTNKMSSPEARSRAVRRYKNVAELFNLYISSLDGYLQLATERILTYRTVLKKLYHFS